MWEDIKYIGYTCTHPFDGFYELRFRKKRNWIIIATVFLCVGLMTILQFYYSGMIVQTSRSFFINPTFAIGASVFPFLIFAVSNWAITTVFDGNGGFGDILMVLAYALVPRLIFDLIHLGLSNIIIQPEMFMLGAVSVIGNVIFGFLVFCGLCVIHEYNPAKCIATLIATAAAAVLLIFLGVVYIILMSRIVGLVTTVFAEITRRGVF